MRTAALGVLEGLLDAVAVESLAWVVVAMVAMVAIDPDDSVVEELEDDVVSVAFRVPQSLTLSLHLS